MTDSPLPGPAEDEPAIGDPDGAEPDGAGPDGESIADANRRRLREALERKRGVQHPDDRASGGSGVRGGATGPAKRDFTRRKSG